MNFGVKKFTVEKDPKKTLWFEHHNLVDTVELGLVTF
jgi:hypothetical protein